MTDESSKDARAERQRIALILKAPEAAGREKLAEHLALATSMSAAEARSALSSAPRGQSKAEIEHQQGAAEARRLLGK